MCPERFEGGSLARRRGRPTGRVIVNNLTRGRNDSSVLESCVSRSTRWANLAEVAADPGSP